MKWFKHLAKSLNDDLIFESIEKFGSDGYLVFFGTLEIMSDEFDIENPGVSRISIKKLTKNFQLSRQKTLRILSFFHQKANEKRFKNKSFFVTIEKDYVVINCNRLAQLCDEHTRQRFSKLRSSSGVAQEKLTHHRREKKEEDIYIVEKSDSRRSNNIPYKQIINYLNKKANTHFKHNTNETKGLIKARWNQGFNVEAFQYVVDVKCSQWLHDHKMVSYLRPSTLFGTKFESYLNEVIYED
ncbi:MAG TPA: conserved phage C-terminal domain-containing protein [Candidatus Thermoplasmatota archaeon]|nr:conserved phage C-terminal domain-containing protein [Candidatus Thermoplasmatota archaeon]